MTRSVNIDFFAAAADQRALLEFVFLSTDTRVFESYSEFGSDLREFKNVDEVHSTWPLGLDHLGNGSAILLQLWSPSVVPQPKIERISLDPQVCRGHTFRHRIGGAGLMQLYFGGVSDKVVTMSHFGHQSQARAESWGAATGVNWEALAKVSGRIQYYLRQKLTAGKVPRHPVLQEAMRLARSGYALKPSIRSPFQYELPPQ